MLSIVLMFRFPHTFVEMTWFLKAPIIALYAALTTSVPVFILAVYSLVLG